MTIERPMFPPAAEHSAILIKFPYEASRRLYSRRPRRSKNGTPEERAAMEPATTTTAAIVRMRPSVSDVKPAVAGAGCAIAASVPDFPSQFRGFLSALRPLFDQRMALGQTVDDIFDVLEASLEGARR